MSVSFEIELDGDTAEQVRRDTQEIQDALDRHFAITHPNENFSYTSQAPVKSDTGCWTWRIVYKESRVREEVCEVLGSPWEDDLILQDRFAGKTPSTWTYLRSGPQSGSQFRSIRKATCRVKSSPCFIATAACGSDDEPDVQTLRMFRDFWLVEYRVGRLLIGGYELLSPGLACLIARSRFLRAVVRAVVVRPCARLVRTLSRND